MDTEKFDFVFVWNTDDSETKLQHDFHEASGGALPGSIPTTAEEQQQVSTKV